MKLLAVIFLLAIVSAHCAPDDSAIDGPHPEMLALLSSHGSDDGGHYATIEGEVKNISDRPLRDVTVVASWYTSDRTFVTSDQALTTFNPILPGQTSPFRVISTRNPAMARYVLAFRELAGPMISTRDDEPPGARALQP